MEKTLRPSPTALLNPCADPIFKSLFTQESQESKRALTYFLSALLGKKISNIILQPNELAVECIYDRQTQFDLTCIADSEPINVEMQGVNIHSSFPYRAEYHVAHLMNHYVVKGSDSKVIPKVYQISVVNFNLTSNLKSYFSHYTMKDIDGKSLGNRMNIVFLELPKLKMIPDNVEKLTEKELWGKFFLYANNPNKQDFLKKMGDINPGIKSAMDILQFLSKDEAQWQQETSHWKYVMDVESAKNEASRLGYSEGFEKGMQEGKQEGIKEGIREGREEGIQQGILEGIRSNQLETAKKMMDKKIDFEIIFELTGVSKEVLMEQ
ncbi:MAG: Rpn family recombination-promoting nuclease/putative transposase [Treponema sp.]|nr:Rpn family recombination-promoting nuclease/putative transposase [Treponema sp.]